MREVKNVGTKRLFILSLALIVSFTAASVALHSLTAEKTGAETIRAQHTAQIGSLPEPTRESPTRHVRESGEYESVEAAVAAARYNADESEEGARADNHANQIRAAFSPEGLVLESNAKDTTWTSRWRLRSLDHGKHKLQAGAGEIETEGNRITISRNVTDQSAIRRSQSAIVTEWFNNTPSGLEHGFTLPERLSDSEENLRLTIQIDGDLEPRSDPDGQNLQLLDEEGRAVLNYEKLRVWDADGIEIAARMTTGAGAVTLEVEEAAAKYPLVIDPTFTASAKLTAADGLEDDRLGYSVAISGDTAVAGAPGEFGVAGIVKGSAYVFVRNANGFWTQQAKLTAADGQAGDAFGVAVAIAADTVVIGASHDKIDTKVSQGSAYVFVRTGTTWTAQEKLVAADGAASDFFGGSVAVSGDTAIIGSTGDDVGSNQEQGSAYVYVRNVGIWTHQQKLTAADGAFGDRFANSIGFAASTVVIGAAQDDIGTNGNQGSAYVYTRSGTSWTLQQKLTAPDGAEVDQFGGSVGIWLGAFSGATLVVGASQDSVGGLSSRGSVYVFIRNTTTWTFQQKLGPSDAVAFEYFGTHVAISGATVISTGQREGGRAWVFARSGGTTWHQRAKLIAFDGDPLNWDVAVSGDTAIFGAAFSSVGTNSAQGSAHFFQLASKPFDFDDDGKSDIGIFRPGIGQWWINQSSTGDTFAAQFGQSSDEIVPADYTGDAKSDLAVFRPSNGNWFVLRSEDWTFYAFPFGGTGDIPAPGDFDNDGKADPAVFRPSSATWYINRSAGGTTIQQFGAFGDVPVTGDYDGDRRADIAIFRPNAPGGAQWWILRSSTGQVFAAQLGSSTDKPVPSDYTGDGKTDVAIWTPSNGTWFVLRSQDPSFYSFPFGAAGDMPVPGDYDGDGKSDAAVFRSSDLNWYINKSSGGALIRQFGAAGDLPLPGAFVP